MILSANGTKQQAVDSLLVLCSLPERWAGGTGFPRELLRSSGTDDLGRALSRILACRNSILRL